MKSAFPFYFKMPEASLQSLWDDGLLCFDASSLLNIYGYSAETSSALLAIIEERRDRLWAPHQFTLEYSRNRPKVIVKQVGNFLKAEKDFDNFDKDRLKPRREHPHLSAQAKEALELVKAEIREKRKLMERRITSDEFLERLDNLFQDKIGVAPNEAALKVLHETAADRLKVSRPPGFADLKDKGEPEAYGDYIAWRQIMDHAKANQKDIILVIDDDKEDWWWKEGTRSVAPLPSLRQEFWEETGQHCWFYSSDGFLRAAKTFTASDVDDVVISEVTEFLEAERQSEMIEKLEPTSSIKRGQGADGKAAPLSRDKTPDAPKGV